MTASTNPIDQVLPAIAQAVAEWQTKNTEEVIKATVKRKLDQASEEITLKLLGFNNSWGKWELDHCNGRAGESAAGDFIKKVQQEAIQEWLTSVMLPKVTPQLASKLKAEAQREYADTLLSKVRQLARNKADADASNLINKIIESKDVDKYIKTMKLLNPND